MIVRKHHPYQSLADILTNIEAAKRYIASFSYEQFKSSDPIIDAVQLRLQNASEAARRLNRDAPDLMREIEQRNPKVQWDDFRGFSSVSRHEYDIIEVSALWKELQPGGPAEAVENAVRSELALSQMPHDT